MKTIKIVWYKQQDQFGIFLSMSFTFADVKIQSNYSIHVRDNCLKVLWRKCFLKLSSEHHQQNSYNLSLRYSCFIAWNIWKAQDSVCSDSSYCMTWVMTKSRIFVSCHKYPKSILSTYASWTHFHRKNFKSYVEVILCESLANSWWIHVINSFNYFHPKLYHEYIILK